MKDPDGKLVLGTLSVGDVAPSRCSPDVPGGNTLKQVNGGIRNVMSCDKVMCESDRLIDVIFNSLQMVP